MTIGRMNCGAPGRQAGDLKRIIMGLCITGLGFASAALAGPQHWGFGFGYLVTVEQNERGQRALSVYEPPLRVKDGAWLLRWRDTSEQYKDVIPGSVAVGNFWPQPMGKEHVVALRSGEKGVELMVLGAPESFSRKPWPLLGRSDYSTSKDERDTMRGLTAGDLLGRGADQLITVHDGGSGGHLPWIRVQVPPDQPDGQWSVLGKLDLNAMVETDAIIGLAAGDFWGTGQKLLAVALKHAASSTPPEIIFLRVERSGSGELTAQTVARAPMAAEGPHALVASDFLKDGFAYVLAAARNTPELAFST